MAEPRAPRRQNKRKRRSKRANLTEPVAETATKQLDCGAAQPPDERRWPFDIAPRLMMLLLALSITLYVIKIGGDPRHYRYLAFPFCLVICAFAGITESMLQRFPVGRLRPVVLLIGLAIIARSVTFSPPQLQNHPFGGMDGIELLPNSEFMKLRHNYHQRVNKIADAATHRHNPTLAQPAWGWSKNIEMKDYYADFKVKFPGVDHLRVMNSSSWCAFMYRKFEIRFVHSLGLTEPILARADVVPDRPAHKEGLIPLAGDLGEILRRNQNAPHPGIFEEMVDSGEADSWIAENLATINIIERKMLNRHAFWENLSLALTFPPKIDPGDRIDRWMLQRQTRQNVRMGRAKTN